MYSNQSMSAPQSAVSNRASFITKTYMHLMGGIIGFVALEYFFFNTSIAGSICRLVFGESGTASNWWIFLIAFMVVSWMARGLARSINSKAIQYIGLGAYIVAEAVIFVPLLALAQRMTDPNLILNAAMITLSGFAALTLIVVVTRKDFSFLRSILMWGGIIALMAIASSFIFGINLGVYFSIAMIALAGGSILYDTSNILYHYDESDYVAASLELFASVAILFWYVLRLLMSLSRD